jgi:tRNA nucleotidyltransferase (CCA-adding enzyme)
MHIYAVGGAVRDALLGLPVTERDWVVVGATPEDLLEQGYRRVGKDFPVFLHPETGEEYALARTERKVAPGYTGFEFDTSSEVTLEQDLQRRDLTVNAMARDSAGALIDPWGGRADLDARVLRHVSPAFREDPLRVLRVARFAARFSPLGFTVAGETNALMRDLAASGELAALKPERIWKETERALGEARPDAYFATLRACGALRAVFPEVDALFGVPQPERWHPEIDTGLHTLLALEMAAKLGPSAAMRFAVLAHDFGKATTPAGLLPRHYGHEERSVLILERFCERLPVPNRFRELAVHVARHHGTVHRAAELRAQTAFKLIEAVDALRQPERFEEFLTACEADARGRTGLTERPYPQAARLRAALAAARAVDVRRLQAETGLEGPRFGEALRTARVEAVKAVWGGGEAAERGEQPSAQSPGGSPATGP